MQEYRVYVPASIAGEIEQALDGEIPSVELVRELRYYCNKHAEAGYPIPTGHVELQYDDVFRVGLLHKRGIVRVLGVVRT